MTLIDKRRARLNFERAAARYDSAAVLQREIAGRLLERLDYVRLEPHRILDLGAGTGHALDALYRRYRKARLVALDFAHGMLLQARRHGSWRRRPLCVCADAESLPLADGAVDLIVSNATFQWCNDLDHTFEECLRVLRPGGLLMFTTFGPDTLKELRQAWATVDGASHVSRFLDMHDIGDALIRARFADPVMDAEHLTLTYLGIHDLMQDLKALGASNVTLDRPRGLTGRARVAALGEAYEINRREGRLPASYEVVYGHAWVPEQKPAAGGISVPISAIGRNRRAAASAVTAVSSPALRSSP
ncbi:MAG: malonyl-ACP O-methyltransferase BioC [Thiocapsa sp.]|jgi:malonyl-CoA O-methyltransferase|nr:malonyl-ACP O-methyltransferase BioC [Thiocapsa sp.]MCG6895943.1 malonyl-ACP O-methyltransferase BioC [Thiocapsa sp.]MCG6985851.1 malonyl-ACP O-methyltransferase BioC [Thiocapsa sp.]